jgi:hypothetical protein
LETHLPFWVVPGKSSATTVPVGVVIYFPEGVAGEPLCLDALECGREVLSAVWRGQPSHPPTQCPCHHLLLLPGARVASLHFVHCWPPCSGKFIPPSSLLRPTTICLIRPSNTGLVSSRFFPWLFLFSCSVHPPPRLPPLGGRAEGVFSGNSHWVESPHSLASVIPSPGLPSPEE